MIQYIYFVKCPNCEDEHFDFFDEAKEFALGCLSQKPIITQTEVERNDFGECTDHCDLGTVWSWEDVVGKETEAEPTTSVFNKSDFAGYEADYNPENDPEFYDDDFFFNNNLIESAATKISFKNNTDREEFFKLCSEIGIITGADLRKFMDETEATDGNLLDKLREYRAELGPDFKIEECTERKPIPDGMTIEQLVETMQENEDMIECAGCENLFPKDECFHKEGIGWLCSDCEDRIVKCTWCNELYDRSECRYEVDLGWLCDRCEAAIKSRGETLTFRENNYWDFLDETYEYTPANDIRIIDKPEDGGKWYTISDLANHSDPLKYVCANDDSKVDAVVSEILADSWLDPEDVYYEESTDEDLEYIKELLGGKLTEAAEDTRTLADLVKDSISHLTNDLGKDPWADDFADDVIRDLENNYDTYVPDDMEHYNHWCSAVASEVSRQVNNQYTLDEELEGNEIYDLGNEYDGGYPANKPELPETDEVSDSHLRLCPECGKESFDTETGICVDCGFN